MHVIQKTGCLSSVLLIAVWCCTVSIYAGVTIPLSTVADPGNPADATDFGAVPYVFQIGTYEVTNAQYAAFLNAVAREDPFGLYHEQMAISRTGSSGSYSYQALEPDTPVVFVSWYDAARFANWLHNGQPEGAPGAGTTEDGAYTFTGAAQVGERNRGATFFLPTENEWYKAAYFQSGVEPVYWLYPTSSVTPPAPEGPSGSENVANYDNAVGAPTAVGSYPLSKSFYGTFDQAGNVWEWNESIIDGLRGLRGGSYDDYKYILQSYYRDSEDPSFEAPFIGFRIAALSTGFGTSRFVRGDTNQDAAVDIGDPIFLLSYLFAQGSQPACLSAADGNDDGKVDIGDAISLLNYLFADMGQLPQPFTSCGEDPTPDNLSCLFYLPCSE